MCYFIKQECGLSSYWNNFLFFSFILWYLDPLAMKWLHKYGQCLGLDSQLCYLVALLNSEKLAVEVFLSREQGDHIKCDVLCVSEGCVRERGRGWERGWLCACHKCPLTIDLFEILEIAYRSTLVLWRVLDKVSTSAY